MSDVDLEATQYAERLAVALHGKHYSHVEQWQPLSGDLIGLLTQIDNMTAGLVRRASPSQRPAVDVVTEALHAAKELAKVAEGLTGCRGDDDFVWGVQEKIGAALASLAPQGGEPEPAWWLLENAHGELVAGYKTKADAEAHEGGMWSGDKVYPVFASPSQVAPANPAQVTDAIPAETLRQLDVLFARTTQGAWRTYQNGVHPVDVGGMGSGDDYAICTHGPKSFANADWIATMHDEWPRIRAALTTAIGAGGQAAVVKRLEWDREAPTEWKLETWKAESLVGEYDIQREKDGTFSGFAPNVGTSLCNSLDEAKAAAQADFEQRVRSYLSQPAKGEREGGEL